MQALKCTDELIKMCFWQVSVRIFTDNLLKYIELQSRMKSRKIQFSFRFFRVPAFLGPSPLLCSSVLNCPGFSGTIFSGSWLICVPSPLFSRWMVWVISMHRLTAWTWYNSLNASQEHLLLMPAGSFGSFCSVRIPASLGPCPTLVCLCFSVLASLGELL